MALWSHKNPVTLLGAKVSGIGWEDVSDNHSGVWVRRFPLPQ